MVVLPPAASWSFLLTSKGGRLSPDECKCKQASAGATTGLHHPIKVGPSCTNPIQWIPPRFSQLSLTDVSFLWLTIFPLCWVWSLRLHHYHGKFHKFSHSRSPSSFCELSHCISQHLLWLLELNPCVTVAQSSWRVSWSGRCPVAMVSVLAPNSYLMSHRRNSPPRPSPSQWIWDKQTNRRTLTSDNPSLALTSKANWFLLV